MRNLYLIIMFISSCICVDAQEEIMLYNSTIPNERGNKILENRILDKEGKLHYIQDITKPFLIRFSPQKKSSTSVIICPGGGYARLNIKNARFIAERMNDWGITVFVLAYRLPSQKIMLDSTTGSLQDVQAALNLVYKRSGEWGLDKNKIGLLGSSAGGHLAAMAATHFDVTFLPTKDLEKLRPDFVVLAWPVTSFRKKSSSSTRLLGETPSEQQIKFYSPDENVKENTPPTFLVHGGNDPAVSVENSLNYYKALRKNKIQAELHIYQNNKHGFGMSPDDNNTWMEQLKEWLTVNNFI